MMEPLQRIIELEAENRRLREALSDCRFQMAAVKVEFGEHVKKTRPSLLESFEKARLSANKLLNQPTPTLSVTRGILELAVAGYLTGKRLSLKPTVCHLSQLKAVQAYKALPPETRQLLEDMA